MPRKLILKRNVYLQATVGIGNVAQLAADVVIETLALDRIGSLEHKKVLPCIGYMPYSHRHSPSGNATAIDIHGSGRNIRVFSPSPIYTYMYVCV